MSDLADEVADAYEQGRRDGHASGYHQAVTNLLDRSKFATYRQQQMHPDANLTETQRRAAVAYLEAVQEKP